MTAAATAPTFPQVISEISSPAPEGESDDQAAENDEDANRDKSDEELDGASDSGRAASLGLWPDTDGGQPGSAGVNHSDDEELDGDDTPSNGVSC
jgi:hypothetical protein